MNLLRFEFKKVLKQKKYIWALVVIVLLTSAIYTVNSNQRSKLQKKWEIYSASGENALLEREWSLRESELIILRNQRDLNYQEEKQLEYLREIGLALQRVRICLTLDRWGDVNRFEKRFLDNLDSYVRLGGEFSALEGIDREMAMAKNQWRIDHDIQFEYEKSPITQHLFLVQSLSLILGIIGIAILLVLFGNTIIEEKENYTWQTIKTQPISRVKLILSKYTVFLFISALFIIMAILAGVLVPAAMSGEWTMNFQYPQILSDGESFVVITVWQYILRNVVLFFCVSSVAFSLNLIVSKWMNKSLSSYFVVGIIIAFGYLITSMIQSPFNPFYLLNFNDILIGLPSTNDWLYIASAVLWSGIFLAITIYLPEREVKTSQVQKLDKPFASGATKIKGKLLWVMHCFEWRKARREGVLKSLAIILLLLVVGGHFLLTNQVEQREADYLGELEWRISRIEESNQYIEERIEEFVQEISEIEAILLENYLEFTDNADIWRYERQIMRLEELRYNLELFEEYLELHNTHLEKLQGAIKGYQEGDWISFFEYQLDVNKSAYEATYPDGQNVGYSETIRRFSKLVSMHEKQLLIERNIKPVMSGEFISTIHEYWGRQMRMGWRSEAVRQEQWAYQNKKVDNSGLFYLYLSYTHYIYLIPLILILFFVGGGMAKEKGKKKTFNFLKTQPLTEEKMFLGKVINSFSIVLVCALTIPLLVVLAGTMLNRFGDWNYPILYYYSYRVTMAPEFAGYTAGGHGYDFINLGKFLLDSTMLFVALSLLIIATANFLSIFFKRVMGVWAATIVLGVGGYWLNGKNPLRISHLSPFTYFNIPKIPNGEMAAVLNDPRVNVQTGLVVLLLLTVAIMISGYLIVNRKKTLETTSKSISRGINLKGGEQ